MTTNHEFDRQLGPWLREDSAHRVPEHLNDVLLRTVATRQRPWWSSLERWLPMDITANRPAFGRGIPMRSIATLAIIALLVAALIAVAIGSRHPLPPPFGPAANGDFVFGANGDIYRFDSTTGAQIGLVTGAGWDFGAGFSRDGTRLTFGRLERDPSVTPDGDQGLVVMMANADGSNVRALTPPLHGNCWSDWSADSRNLVFRTERPGGYGELNVLDVEAGTFRTIDPGISVRCSAIAYRPPLGAEIVFRGDSATDHGVFAIRPDGTGFRRVNTEKPYCECDTGALSPDGRFLALDRWDDTGFVRLWLLDLGAGTERRVPMPAGSFARGGTFSPDGSLIAFPMLHRIGADQNAFQVAIAPIDNSTPARKLGPELTLPPGGSDEAGVSITFSPDGRHLIAGYSDGPTSTTGTIWLLPVDGTPGRKIGSGVFASLDIQRRAP
jgi:dipeptidyl aminopeptidase/acylaminoacyl peptidase